MTTPDTDSGKAGRPNADVATLSYERARDELVAIVQRLEGGSAPLEQTLQLWERGEALAARCRGILDDAQARLDRAGSADQQQPPAADAAAGGDEPPAGASAG